MLRSDPCVHYKMYKAKKNMVYAALFSFAVLGGLSLNQNAKADTVENNNVTPAVQTMTAQSPAADVNAVNSAPTAQPVSAQPVVNNQANSASNVSNQAPTATLNVQPVQPAQNPAAINQANIYAQNFATLQQSAVSNVTATYTGHDDVNNAHEPGWGWQGDASYEFDLDATKAQLNTPIIIGHLAQVSDTGRKMSFQTLTAQLPIYYHAQNIGYLCYDPAANYAQADMIDLQFVLTAKPNAIGTIHISGHYPNSFQVNANSAKNFRGVKTSHNTIQFVDNAGRIRSQLAFTVQQPNFGQFSQWDLSQLKHHIEAKAQHPYFVFHQVSNGEISFGNNVDYPELDPDAVADALHSNNITTPIAIKNQTYLMAGHLSLTNGGTLLTDNNPTLQSFGQMVGTDSQGHYLDYVNNAGGLGLSSVQVINVNPGATLTQMRSMLDPTKNCVLISQQNDGSLLYLSNLTPSFVSVPVSKDQAVADAENWTTTNADDDPDKAAQNSANALINVFHNHYAHVFNYMFAKLADPTVKNTIKLDTLDPNTGAVKSSQTEDFTPNTYMAHGQAAVKLHVINAQNGTELNQ